MLSPGSRCALRTAMLVGLLAMLVGACGGASESSQRRAGIYAAVIRALVPADDITDSVEHTVFVGTRLEKGLPLDLQAELLRELEEFDDLRFVDAPAEAIDEAVDGQPVRNEGVYVEFGVVPDRGTVARVDALVYADEDDRERSSFRVEKVGTQWTVVDREPL